MSRDVSGLLSVTALKGAKAELSLHAAEQVVSVHTHKKIRTQTEADGGNFQMRTAEAALDT